MDEHRLDKNGYGVWYCVHCGLTAPQGHWKPKTWIEKHEKNCAMNPVNGYKAPA